MVISLDHLVVCVLLLVLKNFKFARELSGHLGSLMQHSEICQLLPDDSVESFRVNFGSRRMETAVGLAPDQPTVRPPGVIASPVTTRFEKATANIRHADQQQGRRLHCIGTNCTLVEGDDGTALQLLKQLYCGP